MKKSQTKKPSLINGEKESSLPSPEKCLVKQEFAVRNLLLYAQSFSDCIWERTTGKSDKRKKELVKKENR